MEKLRIIVTGQIAQYPLGGVTSFHLQYVLGLARLGHDVYYVEDSGQWPYDPVTQELPKKGDRNVQYLSDVMTRFGLGDRWAYKFPWESQWFGLPATRREEVIHTADLLLNVCGTLEKPWEYRSVRRLAYLDTDPVFTQVKLARGQLDFRKIIDCHDVQFSYGENPAAPIPDTGHRWRPTRAPIVLSKWDPSAPHRNVYTTVMNWTSHNSVTFQGRTYGQKDMEFKKYLDLPKRVTPAVLELAAAPGHGTHTPYDLLRYKGWRVVDPRDVCADLEGYHSYTEGSKAEFSVAKNGYVVGQSGWFSERSTHYLAAGRPVVVQDTGFRSILPTGEGILPFRTLEEAAEGICAVEKDYPRHARAARAIAEEYFDSGKVLSRLVEEAVS